MVPTFKHRPQRRPPSQRTRAAREHDRECSYFHLHESPGGYTAWAGLYCCLWKRRLRQQHVMLGEDDDDFARVGIMRNNSVSSRATRQRPMSAVSGMSTVTEGHYLPARFAGVPPISRGGFDTTRIEQDPFSVHRVIYPDRVPSPSDDSSHYVLYPDPIPPPAPLRFVAPRPPPPQSLQTWAVASHASEPLVAPTMPAVTMPVPRSPQRVKVPSLLPPVPSRPDSSDGHGPERDQPAASSTRAQSPESHYEEEDGAGAFHMPRRTYLIDRRPEKRRSQ
ncbi:hypothetical protein BKA62DRAFT_391070 [Auriculariales sp. MPI-PUGE-AT-0066]|nr:hypothetical protein BKA62DRAFT_391070 [Auriculariales sp. MPI-PUGE-AT-0066]